MGHRILPAFSLVIIGLAYPPDVSAYVTPGDASSCIQAIIGSLLVAAYMIRNSWKIAIAKLGIELEARTSLESQEVTSKSKLAPNYWEGAIVITGQRNSQPLSGTGYLEMTGYDRPVQFAP